MEQVTKEKLAAQFVELYDRMPSAAELKTLAEKARGNRYAHACAEGAAIGVGATLGFIITSALVS